MVDLSPYLFEVLHFEFDSAENHDQAKVEVGYDVVVVLASFGVRWV
jgi:hypothetical protein